MKTTKEKIVEEASKLFAKNGFDKTSMSEISEQVGIEKASLYYFFKDKRELFMAAVDALWEHLAAIIGTAEGLNRKNFHHYLEKILKAYLQAGLLVLRVDISCTHTEGFRKTMEKAMYMRKRLHEFLLKEKVPHAEIAEALIAHACQGYVIQSQLKTARIEPGKYAKYISNLIFKT